MNNNKLLELKGLLIEKKKDPNLNEQDNEKIRNLECILEDDNLFFKINFETAIGILQFLGIDEDKIINYYNELIAPKNFKNGEDTYITISNIK